jgi:hypothetical protein
MPPRVNRDVNAANANRPETSDKYKLSRLEDDGGDYETFDRSVKHTFFAKGYMLIYDAAQVDAGAPGARHAAATAAQRQGSWGLVTNALGSPLLARIDDIDLGETEDLLRRISEQFFRKTIGGLSTLRKELAETRLEDFTTIEYYFSKLFSRISRIERMQIPPRPYTEEEKAYFLMEGLPADYRTVKQSIKTARPPLTWQEMLTLIRDFASDPSVVGTTSKTARRSNQVMIVDRNNARGGEAYQSEGAFTVHSLTGATPKGPDRSSEPCRDHAKGKCRRGHRCRFSHTATPALPCGYCGMTNHGEDRCFKKQRDEKDSESKQTALTTSEREPEHAQHEYIFHVVVESITANLITETCLKTEESKTHVITVIDGGATCNIETARSNCYDIRREYAEIKVGGGIIYISQEVGKRKLIGYNGAAIEQTNVRIVPGFKINIIAECTFLKAGCRIIKDGDKLAIINNHGKGPTILQCKLQSNLFVYKPGVPPAQAPGAQAQPPVKRPLTSSANASERPSKLARDQPGHVLTLSLPRPLPLPVAEAVKSKSDMRYTLISSSTPDNFPVDVEMVIVSYVGSWFPAPAMTKCGGFAILPPLANVPTSPGPACASTPKDSRTAAEIDAYYRDSAFIARTYSPGMHDSQLWHCRMGHRNYDDVATLLGIPRPTKKCFCRACVEGKSHRHSVNKPHVGPTTRLGAPRPGHTWHSDGIGPLRVASRTGCRKALIFVDDYTDLIHLSLVKSFSALLPELTELDTKLCAEFGLTQVISQLVSDSHSTYTSTTLDTYCRQRGIFQIFSPPFTQALNGKAERTIRTIIEMTRTMLIHACAPRSFFGEAMLYAVHILNRCPRTYPDGSKCTPLERWTGRKQQNAHHSLRVWGCAAWAHDHSQGREKLSAKATLHVFLGIDAQRRCYRLAQLPGLKMVYNAHVIFNESMFPCKDRDPASASADYMLIDEPRSAGDVFDGPTHAPNLAATRARREWTPSGACLRNVPDSDAAPTEASGPANEEALTTLDQRNRHQVRSGHEIGTEFLWNCWMIDYALAALTTNESGPTTPTDHRVAMSLPERQEWRSAEIEEYKAHEENATFGPPVTLPSGFQAIPTAMVYKIKRGGRYKVRVVVRGYRMTAGIDFNETFAPVARITSIRIILALSAKYDLELQQADISTAFLAADMDCDVYVTLPQGFNSNPSTKVSQLTKCSRKVHKLLKGVPGIPQGSHLFNKKLHAVVTNLGYERLADDYCIYKLKGLPIFLAVWVDDLLLAYHRKHTKEATAAFDGLKAAFKMHMLGDVNDLLGATVTRDRSNCRLSVDQSKPILALLQKAGFSDCTPVPTPVASSFTFTKADSPQNDAERELVGTDATWYRSILASCIYMMMWTRPDIAFAVSKLSKFMHNPGAKHIQALKRLLRYLKGTVKHCLIYDFSKPPPRSGVYGYYDAAHADDTDTRRSTMAYIMFFEGCAISWKSKLHTYITTSTNHSEYCASAKAAREAKWLYKMFSAMGYEAAVKPIALFSDSTGAIAMNHNPVLHEANKHVDLADHFAREQVDRGIVTITFVPTERMIADVLTKSMTASKFNKFVSYFMSKIPL